MSRERETDREAWTTIAAALASLEKVGADGQSGVVALCRAAGASAAVYRRVRGKTLFAVARWGLPESFGAVSEIDDEVASRALAAGGALVSLDHSRDGAPDALCRTVGATACAARAVLAAGAPVGVLFALFKEPPADADRVASVLDAVAAAIALEEGRLAAEEGRKRAEEALRQSMKLEVIGSLVGGIAHDFNNGLTIISGNADILRRDEGLSAAAREGAEEIARASRYASDLTRRILAFSRRRAAEPAVFDLNAVITDLSKMLQRAVGERVRLVVNPCDRPALLSADAGQIEQVVMNLAVNARDAMPDGGTLTLAVDRVELAPGAGPQSLRGRGGPFVVLTVADTGVGIAPEVRTRLFEPFFTTKDPGKGTGLGLATVRGIAIQNRGAVVVDGAPGRGARFEVWLPACVDLKTAPSETDAADPAPLSGRRVLIVEDEAPVRALVSRILRNAGMIVFEAASGEEAAAAIEGEGPEVLVSDVVMPGITGYEAARRLRAIWPGLPVVFISGYGDEQTLGAASGCPNSIVLTKPFSPSDLVRQVRRALAAAAAA